MESESNYVIDNRFTFTKTILLFESLPKVLKVEINL